MNSYFNLHTGEEQKDRVLENVRMNIVFSGSNLWILACAIIIASVGLNVNSTAVVIGAMLISPLMGPILGAGFALAMYDFQLLRKSLKNLLISTIIGLLVSFIYFFLSPFKEAQSELLSRISPNIYDVLIAFSGGLVGVISLTRVEKGNPVPGVAIATALMPPLCTAGYGLATGNFTFFLGAMFLYAINCVFICIATYLIAKYLNYPAVGFVDRKREKRMHRWISLIIMLMIVPSIYFAYLFIQQQRFKEKVNHFVQKEFESKGNTIVYKKTSYTDTPKTIELAFLDRKFTSNQIAEENNRLNLFGLNGTRLVIRQDSAFLAEASSKKITGNEVSQVPSPLINELAAQKQRYSFSAPNLFPEVKAIFPEIASVSLAKQEIYGVSDSTGLVPLAMYRSAARLSAEREKILRNFLKARLKVDTIEIYYRGQHKVE